MADAARLLLVVLALGTGLAAITFCALLFQERRSALFRALLANIALFNLLILGGLAFWYARLHLADAGTALVAGLLVALVVVKLAWLIAFVSVARAVASAERRLGLWGLATLGVLALGALAGAFGGLGMGLGLVEVMVLGGALASTAWVMYRSRRALGARRRSLLWFGSYHAAVFAAMLGGLVWGWFGPADGHRVPIYNSLLMIGYNLFPLVWVRAFHSHEEPGGQGDFDRYGITARERQIIVLIGAGKTNREIADELSISLATVKDHNHNIFRKAGVRNRVELINLFRGSPPSPGSSS